MKEANSVPARPVEAPTTTNSAQAHFNREIAIVESGVLADLTALEVKVLMVYMRHADNATGSAYPSIDRVAALVTRTPANTKSRVRNAVKGLVAKGLLVPVRPGGGVRPDGRGNTSVYQVVAPSQTGSQPDPLQTGSKRDPVLKAQRGSIRAGKGGRFASAKGVHSRLQRGSQNDPRTTHRTTQGTAQGNTHIAQVHFSAGSASGGTDPSGSDAQVHDGAAATRRRIGRPTTTATRATLDS